MTAATVEGLRKWCPDHRPLLTFVPVETLVLEEMRVEVEMEAVRRGARGEGWGH